MLITTSAATACLSATLECQQAPVAECWMENSRLLAAIPRGVATGQLLLQAIQVWMPTL